jgi:hypothetical protein
MSVEVRRRAAEHAFRRARESGRPIEQDELFHGWINDWINGDLEMSEVARRYRTLVRERSELRRSCTPSPATEIPHGSYDD